jgi:alpha-1,6-mannosyltransferase
MAIKTLHLTNAWHESSGGIATFYRALLQAANRQRSHVRLVVPGPADGIENVGEFGRIYHLAAPKAPLNPAYRMIYPTRFLLSGSTIQHILQAEQPDLVEICDKYCLNYLGALLRLQLLREVAKRPVVVGLSCERMDQNLAVYMHRSVWAEKLSAAYMRYLYFPFFDHHITVSDLTAAELQRASLGQVVERGVWIRPMGVDFDNFSPGKRSPEARKELLAQAGAKPDSVLLLYVGRLAPEKNLTVLAGMMEALSHESRDYRLIVVGDGIERQRLEAEAARRAPRKIAFLGHIGNRKHLARIYANSDLFTHPNQNEPFGIAPLEAMASGLPLIAPDSGGVKSYADDSNSFLVTGSAESFAEAVRTAMATPELRRVKAEGARLTAKRFSWPVVTDSFLELYHSLYAIGRGILPIQDAVPAFCSTPADLVQTAASNLLARTGQAGFKLFNKLATMRPERHRTAPRLIRHSQETP